MRTPVSATQMAGIMSGCFVVIAFAGVVGVLCWRYPSCRSRTFWNKAVLRRSRRMYGKCQKDNNRHEKTSLATRPSSRKRTRGKPPFVVPQILVDYGSRRTSCISASGHVSGSLVLDLRRSSGSSAGSRRTSLVSESDRRGSNSSIGSRRTSFASDSDRRWSASSFGSHRSSIFSEWSDRRESASSRSSRKDSDASHFDDIEASFADLSDPENGDIEEGRDHGLRCAQRRTTCDVIGPYKELQPSYRRAHSLAENRAGREEQQTGERESRAFPKSEGCERRQVPTNLTVCSLGALDQAGNPAFPPHAKKRQKRRILYLPCTPPANPPDHTEPLKPTGRLKLQLLWSQDRTSLTVIIVEALALTITGMSQGVEINPYVKAFLLPCRSFQYRTKTLRGTTDPLFLEKFVVRDLLSGLEGEQTALEFQIYSSHHISRRHLVGVASVRLAEEGRLASGQVELLVAPRSIPKVQEGDLRISGCYMPLGGQIAFNVVEARNLPGVSLLGTTNPYVKVEMYVNGVREGKSKSKVRQNSLDPVWHHQVVFEVNRENPRLMDHTFVFHVLHKDMMTGVHKIGQVTLGWSSRGEQLGAWMEIMEPPHRPTDTWHSIVKPGKANSSSSLDPSGVTH